MLVATALGSAVMAGRLTGGNGGLALLACALVTAGVLAALIVTLGPLSGAHLNPVVTLALTIDGELSRREALFYVVAQLVGAWLGMAAVHLMFELPVLQVATTDRSGAARVFGEFVATFGLVLLVLLCVRQRAPQVAFVVAGYIAAAYWFTSSTSFANPAVTLARAVSDTPSGIRPADVPGFLLGQFTGAAAATALARWLMPLSKKVSS
jgi:glycerol uptake facilitator-like aquaporin